MAPRGHKAGAALPPASEEERASAGTGEGGEAVAGDTLVADEEPSVVKEPGPGELDESLSRLGDAVARENSRVDLSEEAHRSAIEGMERMGDDLQLDTGSMVSGVRDFLLDIIKARPKPWSATSSAEQRDVAAACEQLADGLVRQIVEAIRADGKTPVRVLLEKVTLSGDAIQIAGKVKTFEAEEEDRAVIMLHHARGKHVLLTVASVDDYKGQHAPAKTDEEEPPLPFEAGEHPEDDSDLADEVEASEEQIQESGEIQPIRTGDVMDVPGHGSCEMLINLKTGWVQAHAAGAIDDDGENAWTDIREATTIELSAERERVADFDETEEKDEGAHSPAAAES